MGISRSSRHKRSHTGAKRAHYRKKRKFDLGRQPANTKLGGKRIHPVRTRGGNEKFRALRLEAGNFSWGSEAIAHKTRILSVVFNATSNELVRTNTLVKSAVVQIDATPFRNWYESHYVLPLGRKQYQLEGLSEEDKEKDVLFKKRSESVMSKIKKRQENGKVSPALEEQFQTGRLYAKITSRPGQCGRADGYVLEGEELDFYVKRIKSKK
ncbi:ribosomal protein S8A [Tieghemiomyces parasiticus]|uniref:40S ribosomal protein S8 n=1 Tax=Tieghemiomyces parasiticus TaxID=78921 RepID=A0A9W8AJZ8_9FUNG|nr:ribosomal protein S8A [Tieghemiomyces parasiticus]KAJ1928663.1 ribosomal protein S8A [Tieghemiomyces parasiticus]